LDSHVRPPVGPRPRGANAQTERLTGLPLPLGAEVDLRQAYVFARSVARASPAQAPSQPGHRLVWVRRDAFASSMLVAAEDAFAVVGRHTQCGVILPDDPFVALRHVLVRSVALPAGGVALRLVDLHTGLGFVLPDGSRHTSVFAEGPIAIALGEYALVALPSESHDDQLPGEMPPPVLETPAAVREQLEALAALMSPYRANARPANHTSRITLMPSPVMVGAPLPPSLDRLAHGGSFAITLSRGGRSATVTVGEQDLARGVVIGRSEKCHAEVLRQITAASTSRVHVLVLREGPIVHAYDLASTHGTFVDGVAMRRFVLHGGETTLTLGRGHDAVRFLWRSRG
jgi:hypothetical protein